MSQSVYKLPPPPAFRSTINLTEALPSLADTHGPSGEIRTGGLDALRRRSAQSPANAAESLSQKQLDGLQKQVLNLESIVEDLATAFAKEQKRLNAQIAELRQQNQAGLLSAKEQTRIEIDSATGAVTVPEHSRFREIFDKATEAGIRVTFKKIDITKYSIVISDASSAQNIEFNSFGNRANAENIGQALGKFMLQKEPQRSFENSPSESSMSEVRPSQRLSSEVKDSLTRLMSFSRAQQVKPEIVWAELSNGYAVTNNLGVAISMLTFDPRSREVFHAVTVEPGAKYKSPAPAPEDRTKFLIAAVGETAEKIDPKRVFIAHNAA